MVATNSWRGAYGKGNCMALTDAELCLAIYCEVILGQLQCNIAEGMRSGEGASKQLNTIIQFLAENFKSIRSV
jgi:hypothetical protein